ncbi:MAG: glycosyltransferase family 2 protein [Enterococcus sp.]
MISFILPIYNTPKEMLLECLQSIRQLQGVHYEILLIDDGSDEYIQVLGNQLSQADAAIHYYRQENQGVSVARNTGILRATGEWLVFVDPDDVLVTNAHEALHQLSNNPNDICFMGYQTFQETGVLDQFEGADLLSVQKTNPAIGEILIASLLEVSKDRFENQGYYLGTPWGKAFKKAFLLEHELKFDAVLKKRQDALFCAQVYAHRPQVEIITTNSIVYGYRKDNPKSVSKRYNPQIKELYLYLFAAMKALGEAQSVDYSSSLSFYAYDLLKELTNLDFCNVHNSRSYSERKQAFLTFRNNPVVQSYFANYQVQGLGLGKRVLYLAEYKKWFFALNLIYLKRRAEQKLQTMQNSEGKVATNQV